ncbi:DUF1801 domain-containing protein [Agromyces marinus]|uniref:YdhG-like domain-containing protein n=1 Tax=Agromyces marinus TaxID=1389020 RepID=A0ABM8GY80_9MICO|nr:DUF1801 domain-containing protein [Agromyces marinus]UIP58348.1 hypothetical protein DSM26151_12190 [Agromyces marinus]BDZ53399.1 hypothetical protein GCM10025870_04720 [Agromyces marinus]
MAEAKTVPTGASVSEFLDRVEPAGRRADGFELRELFDRVTDTDAVMWGPSIVGYGLHHYRYESGREGDSMVVGFSPRKASVSLYGLQTPGAEELIDRLGKVKVGAGCLWVGRLETIDRAVLESLVDRAWVRTRGDDV